MIDLYKTISGKYIISLSGHKIMSPADRMKEGKLELTASDAKSLYDQLAKQQEKKNVQNPLEMCSTDIQPKKPKPPKLVYITEGQDPRKLRKEKK